MSNLPFQIKNIIITPLKTKEIRKNVKNHYNDISNINSINNIHTLSIDLSKGLNDNRNILNSIKLHEGKNIKEIEKTLSHHTKNIEEILNLKLITKKNNSGNFSYKKFLFIKSPEKKNEIIHTEESLKKDNNNSSNIKKINVNKKYTHNTENYQYTNNNQIQKMDNLLTSSNNLEKTDLKKNFSFKNLLTNKISKEKYEIYDNIQLAVENQIKIKSISKKVSHSKYNNIKVCQNNFGIGYKTNLISPKQNTIKNYQNNLSKTNFTNFENKKINNKSSANILSEKFISTPSFPDSNEKNFINSERMNNINNFSNKKKEEKIFTARKFFAESKNLSKNNLTISSKTKNNINKKHFISSSQDFKIDKNEHKIAKPFVIDLKNQENNKNSDKPQSFSIINGISELKRMLPNEKLKKQENPIIKLDNNPSTKKPENLLLESQKNIENNINKNIQIENKEISLFKKKRIIKSDDIYLNNYNNLFTSPETVRFNIEKSNLIKKNTFSLLKNKNSDLNFFNSELSKNNFIKINENIDDKNNDSNILLKESLLQSHIDFNLDNDDNNLNLFQKYENKENFSFSSKKINSKKLENFEIEKINFQKKNKTATLLDTIIPDNPIKRIKDKPILIDLINDIKDKQIKYSPLSKKEFFSEYEIKKNPENFFNYNINNSFFNYNEKNILNNITINENKKIDEVNNKNYLNEDFIFIKNQNIFYKESPITFNNIDESVIAKDKMKIIKNSNFPLKSLEKNIRINNLNNFSTDPNLLTIKLLSSNENISPEKFNKNHIFDLNNFSEEKDEMNELKNKTDDFTNKSNFTISSINPKNFINNKNKNQNNQLEQEYNLALKNYNLLEVQNQKDLKDLDEEYVTEETPVKMNLFLFNKTNQKISEKQNFPGEIFSNEIKTNFCDLKENKNNSILYEKINKYLEFKNIEGNNINKDNTINRKNQNIIINDKTVLNNKHLEGIIENKNTVNSQPDNIDKNKDTPVKNILNIKIKPNIKNNVNNKNNQKDKKQNKIKFNFLEKFENKIIKITNDSKNNTSDKESCNIDEDSQITEIDLEEVSHRNNLQDFYGKFKFNGQNVNQDDSDDKSSLIDFNLNIVSNSNINSNNISSYNNSFNITKKKIKKIQFTNLLKIHNFVNINIINIQKNSIYSQNNFLNEKTDKEDFYKTKKISPLNYNNININFDKNQTLNGGEKNNMPTFENLNKTEITNNNIIKNINLHLVTFENSEKKINQNFFYKKKNITKKFLSNSILKILNFLNAEEIQSLYFSCHRMKFLLIDSLMLEINNKLVTKFKENCKEYLDLLDKKLIFKKNKNGNLLIDLLISSRLKNSEFDNFLNKTITLIFTSQSGKQKNFYNNLFKFDLNSNNSSHQTIWLCKEFKNYSIDSFLKCYLQPTIEFKLNDIVYFSINLFADNFFIDFNTINFKIKIQKNLINIPNIISEINKITTKSKIDYTEFNLYNGRINEFEYLKMKWRDIQAYEMNEEIIKKIKNIFQDFFEIIKCNYDDVGNLVFKFTLKAIKTGMLDNQTDLGIKIRIKEEKDYIVNEIKKNNLIYEKSDVLEIRECDTLIFYFSEDR